MMRYSFVWLLITFLLLINISPVLGKWELKLREGKWDRSIGLVHFISPTQGWAVGFSNTDFWTEDGGETWTRRDLNIWPTASFPNATDGWQPPTQGQHLIRGSYPPIGVQIPFERSFDGGLSWREMTGIVTDFKELNSPPRPWEVRVFGASAGDATFYFLDSQIGFVAGSTELYGGMPDTRDAFRAFYIGKTTDGGKTWALYLHWGNWTSFSGLVRKIEFFDVQNGWVLVESPSILYRTHDGGQTWRFQFYRGKPGVGIYFKSIEFPTSDVGWASLQYQVIVGGEVWRTTDGGETWQIVSKVTHGIPGDIFFINPQEGWIILNGRAPGLGVDSPFKGIVHTQDGGRNWEVELDITSDEKGYLNRFSYDPLTQTLWVSGNYETLYKRTTPVVSVSPRGKLPLTWGQLKQSRKEK